MQNMLSLDNNYSLTNLMKLESPHAFNFFENSLDQICSGYMTSFKSLLDLNAKFLKPIKRTVV